MSAEVGQDFTTHSGDDEVLSVQILDDAVTPSVPVDLTGTTVTWAMAKNPNSASPLVSKNTTVGGVVIDADPTAGKIKVTIDAADTKSLKGAFYHEVEIIDGFGKTKTVMTGTITILAALIRSP